MIIKQTKKNKKQKQLRSVNIYRRLQEIAYIAGKSQATKIQVQEIPFKIKEERSGPK